MINQLNIAKVILLSEFLSTNVQNSVLIPQGLAVAPRNQTVLYIGFKYP